MTNEYLLWNRPDPTTGKKEVGVLDLMSGQMVNLALGLNNSSTNTCNAPML